MCHLRAVIFTFQVVSQGHFATVWRGNYQGSKVAVKVFPPCCDDKWTAEREVYELPLMKHAGIVPFLGCGKKPEGGSLLMVLQFAEHVSDNQTRARVVKKRIKEKLKAYT